jgi:hypothetical protein
MRADAQAVSSAHVDRTEVVEEAPRTHHASLAARQRTPYGHTLAEHRVARCDALGNRQARALWAVG